MSGVQSYTPRNIFEILLNRPEIRLYLPCTDWFGFKRTSVWIQIYQKMVNTIWYRVDFIWFQKDFSECITTRFLWREEMRLLVHTLRPLPAFFCVTPSVCFHSRDNIFGLTGFYWSYFRISWFLLKLKSLESLVFIKVEIFGLTGFY